MNSLIKYSSKCFQYPISSCTLRFSFSHNQSSNIKPIKLVRKSDESRLSKYYHNYYEDTWKWLDDYWKRNNNRLVKGKQKFMEDELSPNSCNKDIDEFYRQFLQENRADRIRFNLEWYRRIGYIVLLGMLVDFQNLLHKPPKSIRKYLEQLRLFYSKKNRESELFKMIRHQHHGRQYLEIKLKIDSLLKADTCGRGFSSGILVQ